RLQQFLVGQPLEVGARLAKAPSLAQHRTHAKAPSDQRVQRDSAGGEIAARLACLHRDPEAVAQGFEDLRLDEGQSTAGSRLVGGITAAERVTISFDSDSADEPDPADRAHRLARAP